VEVGFSPNVNVAPPLEYATLASHDRGTNPANLVPDLDLGAEMLRSDELPQRGTPDAALLSQNFGTYHLEDAFAGAALHVVEAVLEPITARSTEKQTAEVIPARAEAAVPLPDLSGFEASLGENAEVAFAA
jgi:hypothetical protein